MIPRSFFTRILLNKAVSKNGSWKAVPMGPTDPILGITAAYKKDKNPDKINVGVGAYQTEEGKPWVLPSIKAAEMRVVSSGRDMELIPIHGNSEFIKVALNLLYGPNCAALKEERIAAAQSISGTGALRLCGAFISAFSPVKSIYISDPTWSNHFNIFRDAGLETHTYTYWDPKTKGVNFTKMMADLEKAPDGSAVVLHACAHNPTGVDLSKEQWQKVLDLCIKKRFLPVIDCAYQGFATGDTENDAYAVRLFADAPLTSFITQSFAKNMGLYGHRTGTASVICSSKEEAERVLSQLKIIIRGMYSSPPIHGARIVHTVLSDKALEADWKEDVKVMANRMKEMRGLLRKNLEELGSKRDWEHLTSQIGMFCYTGLSEEECKELTNKHHVYLTLNGRLSLTGVNKGNVKRLAKAIHDVTSK